MLRRLSATAVLASVLVADGLVPSMMGLARRGAVRAIAAEEEPVAGPEEVLEMDTAMDTAMEAVSEEVEAVSEAVSEEGGKRRKKEDATPLSEIEVGKSYEGTVTGITSYGCFVDINAESDGLVHISQLSSGYVEDVSDVVETGQSVTVRVLSVDMSKKQMALSMKPERRSRPGREPKKRAGPEELRKYADYDPKTFIDGTVVNIKPFGAFVNVEPGLDGLVHISQIANERTERVEDVLEIGQAVKVRVIEVDMDRVTLGLSMTEPYSSDASSSSSSQYSDEPAPSSGPRQGRSQRGADDFADDYRPSRRPKFNAADDDDSGLFSNDDGFPEDDAPTETRARRPKRAEPGDDIWETKPHEDFDWQAAMAEVHQTEDANDFDGALSFDPTTGKLTLQ